MAVATEEVRTGTAEDFNGSAIVDVPIDRIDMPDYQTTLKPGWARELAEGWDSTLFRHPILNEKPDGRYDAIDGQHTIEAAKMRGQTHVPCLIRRLEHREAAGTYVDLNTRRRRPTPMDEYRAGRIAGRPWAVALDTITARYGLTVSLSKSPDHIGCIGQARQIILAHGEGVLDAALLVLTHAYEAGPPENATRLDRDLILGMADLVRKSKAAGIYDSEYFVKHLKRAKFTTFGVPNIRVTPRSMDAFLAALIQQGLIPIPPMSSGMGTAAVYGRALSLAILGVDRTKTLYGQA